MNFVASTIKPTLNTSPVSTNSVWGRKRNIDDLLEKLSSNSTKLSSLNIMSTRSIKNEDVEKLRDILSTTNDTLTELYASGHMLDSIAVEHFASILENNNKLKLLSIGNSSFGNKNLSSLCKGLLRNSGLVTLDLEYKGLNGRVEAEELFTNLTRAVNSPISVLENINLSRNLLYNDGLRKLTDGFVTNEGFGKIKSLSLCDIGCSGGEAVVPFGAALANLFRKNNDTKSKCSNDDYGKKNLPEGKKSLTLDLSRNSLIGSLGCSAFISTGILNVVSELCLDNCSIGDLGLDTIARAFIYNNLTSGKSSKITLQKLSVRSNSITSISILNLINALSCSNNIISDLDFGNNKCGNEAFRKLFCLNGLKKLCLLGNGINDNSVKNLQHKDKEGNIRCTLEYLDLCGNNVTDVGSKILCDRFISSFDEENNNTIKTLVLGSNPGISHAGVAAIEEVNKNYSKHIRILYDIGQNTTNNDSLTESESKNNNKSLLSGGERALTSELSTGSGAEKRFKYYLSPYESSRVEKAINDNFNSIFEKIDPGNNNNDNNNGKKQVLSGLDFVWIHTLSKDNYDIRMASTVCSQIAGIEVLENKANLALLCKDLDPFMALESYVVYGRAQFIKWCEAEQRKMKTCVENNENYHDGWIAKDSTANGGEGLYQFTISNDKYLSQVQGKIDDATEYVIQRYVNNPLLWDGKYKFHFRVYCVLNASMEFYAYRKAFAHVCNKEYVDVNTENDEFDPEIHISNVAANIHDENYFHNYPTVDLPTEFPSLWLKIESTMKNIIRESSKFMQYQTSQNNFMLIGADFIPDANGNAWLLELNCPPCMAAYQGADEEALESNKFEQAIRPLVSSVVRDVINDFVLPILYRKTFCKSNFVSVVGKQGFISSRSGNFIQLNSDDEVIKLFEPSIANGAKDLSKNTLSWKVFKWRMGKKNLKKYNTEKM